jgi:hypothetical protein
MPVPRLRGRLFWWRSLVEVAVAATLGTITLTACDPSFQISGSIKDATGAPIPNAKVALVCGGDDMASEATSGPDGSVSYGRIGWYSDACVARVRATGFVTQELPIGHHCVRRYRGEACQVVHIDPRLQPSNQLHPDASSTARTTPPPPD